MFTQEFIEQFLKTADLVNDKIVDIIKINCKINGTKFKYLESFDTECGDNIEAKYIEPIWDEDIWFLFPKSFLWNSLEEVEKILQQKFDEENQIKEEKRKKLIIEELEKQKNSRKELYETLKKEFE